MDVLLIRPPQKTNEIQPPLGLGYIASNVKDICNVKILDCIKDKINIKKFKEFIKENKYDIIGFQCYSMDIGVVKELSNFIKSIYPKTFLVVGGPQPSLDPINTLQYLEVVDYGFCGEAEDGFKDLINFLKNKKPDLDKIPGLIYKKTNKFIKNETKRIEDLDRLNPGWEFFNLKSYPVAPHGAFFKQAPTAPLIVTRGCPFNCTYCGGPIISGRKVRSHSVDYIINQIEYLVKNYGIREIHIEDDNFTINRKFVIDFCNKLIEKNFGITWAFPNGVRIDTLDKELVQLMKKAGLYSLSFGIESGSDRIRKLMKKNLDSKTILEKLEMIKSEGIPLIGFFIVGYPGETEEDINETINFALKLPLDRATFSAFKPFPGTSAYNELKAKGELGDLIWENFSLDKIAWSSKEIGNKKLKNLRRKAFLKFYARPKIQFKMLTSIRSLSHLKYITVRIFRWLS